MGSALAVRADVDTAGGGTIRASNQGFVRITAAGDSARLAIVEGDPVDTHSSHSGATMAEGCGFVLVVSVAWGAHELCRAGNLASCGHACTGSGPVTVVEL